MNMYTRKKILIEKIKKKRSHSGHKSYLQTLMVVIKDLDLYYAIDTLVLFYRVSLIWWQSLDDPLPLTRYKTAVNKRRWQTSGMTVVLIGDPRPPPPGHPLHRKCHRRSDLWPGTGSEQGLPDPRPYISVPELFRNLLRYSNIYHLARARWEAEKQVYF